MFRGCANLIYSNLNQLFLLQIIRQIIFDENVDVSINRHLNE